MNHPALPFVVAVLALAVPASAQLIPESAPIEAGIRAEDGRYEMGTDLLHYEIELALSDISTEITASARLRIAATRDDVDRITLDFTGLALDSLLVDGVVSEDASLAGGRLRIGFSRPLSVGEVAEVEIHYSGTPDDGLILRENVEGAPSAFVDNWPNRTRFWLPSVDHPSDKASVGFTIHAPAAWEVVANGRLVGQPYPTPEDEPGPPTSGPRRTWRYTSDVPHPTYTFVVGAAEMVVDLVGVSACGRAPASARPDGCVETTTWLYPGSVESGAPSFTRAGEMLDFFAELVGPFPWEKLAHVQSATRFGGMENSSAIFYSEAALARGADIEGTVSHEIAHQWFGDSVTQSEWGHLWLSEGFATYFGALFFEYADGHERFREVLRGERERYLAAPDSLRPLVDLEETNLFELLNRNSYQKGALVLHMLRTELGDEAFFDGIRLWHERFRDGNAVTADLEAVLEEVSGRRLDTFFEQWAYHPGHPVLETTTDADPESGGLRVTIQQVQGDYAPRYELAVPVRLSFDGETRDTTIHISGARSSVVFGDVPPGARVEIDPDLDLLIRRIGG